jgi:hypothetical protein
MYERGNEAGNMNKKILLLIPLILLSLLMSCSTETSPVQVTPAYTPKTVAPISPTVDLKSNYLRQAAYYQRMASSELNDANQDMKSANLELSFKTSSSYSRYQLYMGQYQRHMVNYASYQKQANEYLILGQ